MLNKELEQLRDETLTEALKKVKEFVNNPDTSNDSTISRINSIILTLSELK